MKTFILLTFSIVTSLTSTSLYAFGDGPPLNWGSYVCYHGDINDPDYEFVSIVTDMSQCPALITHSDNITKIGDKYYYNSGGLLVPIFNPTPMQHVKGDPRCRTVTDPLGD